MRCATLLQTPFRFRCVRGMLSLSAQGASDKGQQMAISMENAQRMMALTASPNLDEADFPFFRNHITPFAEWLVEKAIEDLVRLGIDHGLASSILKTTSFISKMSGANDLFDYGVTATLMEGMDNA